jgi:HD superfamily phosphodiesterase
MKLAPLLTLVNRAFQFVIQHSERYHIDESHALRHSLDVYHYAREIYTSELPNHPILEEQQPIIYTSAILHDMCDKKYMDESFGLNRIREYMRDYMSWEDLMMMSNIISTMSYSRVKKFGYPDWGEHQMAYHIVRESDLLAAYDVERSLIYQLAHDKYLYSESMEKTKELFESRVFRYIPDKLFFTDYSQKTAVSLHKRARETIQRISDTSFL